MSWLTRALVWLFKNRREVKEVSEEVIELVHPKDKGTPLPYKSVRDIERQIAEATSHKVKP